MNPKLEHPVMKIVEEEICQAGNETSPNSIRRDSHFKTASLAAREPSSIFGTCNN